MQNRITILGVPFSAYTGQEVLERCKKFMQDGRPHFVITAGPEFVMKAVADEGLKAILAQADLVTPDGIGIVVASRWYRQPLAERVTGIDLAEQLLAYAAEEGLRVYLLGADEGSLQSALGKIGKRFPTLHVAGRNGYFKPGSTPEVVAAVRAESPHLLLVGMGQPRQERFIAEQLEALGVPLAIGVGGAIDVLGGTVKRAPEVFQKARLEWLYRLLREPARLRRQLALPRFALAAWLDSKSPREESL